MSLRSICLALCSLTVVRPIYALDDADQGIYAIVHIDGHVTNKEFRVSHSSSGWTVEDHKPDGSWEDVSCQPECTMRESSPSDLAAFLGVGPSAMSTECIQNSAFAICRSNEAGTRQYTFFTFVENQLHSLKLARKGK
jgi:hypothetical protein